MVSSLASGCDSTGSNYIIMVRLHVPESHIVEIIHVWCPHAVIHLHHNRYSPTSLAERLCLAAMEALDCGDTDTTTSFCSLGWTGKIVCVGGREGVQE